jgi:hypothetical protein
MFCRPIGAVLLAVAIPAAVVTAPAARAQAHCNSFNYGIGSCVNAGPFRPQYRNQPGYGSGGGSYNNGSQPLLLDQPRFQPQFPNNYGIPSYGR